MAETEDTIVDINNENHVQGGFDFGLERAFVTDASKALGIEGSIKDILDYEQNKANRFQPKETIEQISRPDPEPDPEPVAEEESEPEPAIEDKPEPVVDEKPEPKPKPEPVEPTKFKFQGREYTEEELADLVAKANAPRQELKEEKVEEQPKPVEPTPEEIAAKEQEFLKVVQGKINGEDFLTDDDVENVLVGGEKALETLRNFAKQTAAKAVLEARKSIYNELNPILSDLHNKVAPVIEQTQNLEKYTTTQIFNQRHPEFVEAGQLDLATEIANQLVKTYPEQVGKMSKEQFVDEVARQADRVVQNDFKKWYPTAEGTWKDHLKAQKTPQPEEPQITEPVVEEKPVAKQVPKPRPPASSSVRITGGQPEDWHKKTASSLI